MLADETGTTRYCIAKKPPITGADITVTGLSNHFCPAIATDMIKGSIMPPICKLFLLLKKYFSFFRKERRIISTK
jgi:hypothetical protein